MDTLDIIKLPLHLRTKRKPLLHPFGTFAFRRMSFGLCNAPATFQRCMMSIFSDLAEEVMETFMDDFTVYGSSFENCLHNLGTLLHRCQDKNLALNWKKCHFMVT